MLGGKREGEADVGATSSLRPADEVLHLGTSWAMQMLELFVEKFRRASICLQKFSTVDF